MDESPETLRELAQYLRNCTRLFPTPRARKSYEWLTVKAAQADDHAAAWEADSMGTAYHHLTFCIQGSETQQGYVRLVTRSIALSTDRVFFGSSRVTVHVCHLRALRRRH